VKLYVIPVGQCDNDKGRVFIPGEENGNRIIAPNWVGLIQVFGLNILIDTGMHPNHIELPQATFKGTRYETLICPQMKRNEFILNQLSLISLKSENIDYVVNTHLHFDHAGCNEYFPKATFIVQKDHYLYALSMPDEFPKQYYNLPELNYELILGEMSLVPGIDLIRCPGHVPGMMGVVLRFKNSAPIIIASDAISIKDCIVQNNWQASWNPILARNSANRLISLTNIENGQLFFGHDPEWWKSVRKFPEYYD